MGKCEIEHRCTNVMEHNVSAIRGYTQKHGYLAELQSQNHTDLRPGPETQHKTLHEVHRHSERVFSGQTAGISTRSLNKYRGKKTDVPWQTTIQLQGQTYLGCGVSLDCMWSHSVESKGKEDDPHADCATPCMGTFTQGLKKIRKTT